MLEDIDQWICRADDEWNRDVWLAIAGMQADGTTLRIQLHARDDAGQHTAAWVITAQGVVECNLGVPGGNCISVTDDHPVLMPLVADNVQLFVRRAPRDRASLLARLWEAHRRLLMDWISADRFLNWGYVDSAQAPKAQLGMLASGPRPLLTAYAEAAEAEGMHPRIVDQGRPGHYLRDEWVNNPRTLQALVVGRGWCAAESFDCERLSATD